jgi:hypothetical protein
VKQLWVAHKQIESILSCDEVVHLERDERLLRIAHRYRCYPDLLQRRYEAGGIRRPRAVSLLSRIVISTAPLADPVSIEIEYVGGDGSLSLDMGVGSKRDEVGIVLSGYPSQV